jgi:Na+-translocating ferredoxin:NAD+ oxidoreductase RNF subunit RnfB
MRELTACEWPMNDCPTKRMKLAKKSNVRNGFKREKKSSSYLGI